MGTGQITGKRSLETSSTRDPDLPARRRRLPSPAANPLAGSSLSPTHSVSSPSLLSLFGLVGMERKEKQNREGRRKGRKKKKKKERKK
jgi:hypothetical protein